MVYKSKYPDVAEAGTGIIQFIFSNKNNVPEDKKILIDALNLDNYLTYAQLKDSVLKLAAGLQDICGFQQDDILALYSHNQYNYSVPLLAAVAAGGATTTANPNYNEKELTYQLDATKAKVIICHQDNLETALVAGANAGVLRKNIFLLGDKPIGDIRPFTDLMNGRKAVPVELSAQEAKEKVAYLCFSSGTTGKSKGVMTTHANITANTLQYTSFDDKWIDPNVDRMIGVLPLFHIFGLTNILHAALYWGVPVYILPRFDLVKFCETVQSQKITFASLVPPIFVLLAKHEIIPKYDLSTLKISISGAAPLSGELGRAVKARLPNLTIKQGYGLTETSPSAIVEPTDRTIDGSTGVLLPNMLAKVVDENGKEVPQGERGELWLKGPNIMKGYINNPEATAECIDAEGYFHTGDVVVVDKDEHFYIVDRIKELIKYKGFQVPPAELEGILLQSPMVADCAVVGVYDSAQATELPRAYITLNSGVKPSETTAAEIMKFVADQVVPYKQIRSVRFIDAIPKNPSGKILRRVLRDSAEKEEKEAGARARL